jgi:hypothetical protein
MDLSTSSWLLLIISLPTNSATGRMRIWRALKGLGCSALRDGAYLLPDRADTKQQFSALLEETTREGGSAWLLTVQPQSAEEHAAYQALFDRSNEYAELIKAVAQASQSAAGLKPQELNRSLRKLRRDYDALRTIDYFPGDAARQAEAVWMDFVSVAESILSAGEPHTIQATIPQRNLDDYQARQWATRQRLWVDRVASAWLIRRFIDPKATFLWLESPGDCPEDALGFDFDGATFTHVGDRVTFEVLLISFGLDRDGGLARLGAMVHTLDIGNGFVAEAAGFEAMLSGIRQRVVNDDQLLHETSPVLDALYAHFSNESQSQNGKKGTPSEQY